LYLFSGLVSNASFTDGNSMMVLAKFV